MKAVATKAIDSPTAMAKKTAMGKYSDRNSDTWHSCEIKQNAGFGIIQPCRKSKPNIYRFSVNLEVSRDSSTFNQVTGYHI
jgi:hypothetical protein